ncbi:MAG TPA: serine/threonine-protein kinase [Polyangiaceae bacterium]|nr:serine/threonine-protein kinase [Polyangiaceae bacterium]
MLSGAEIFAGRYRVLERIAQGGMGVVYAAEHLATEERVALKVLFPHVLASKAAVDSFQLEARVTARIGSEHVVRVLDAGFDEKAGVPFLAMELLRGCTLRALVAGQGPLPGPQAVVVLRQVAEALDRAHGYVDREGRPAPIVHRDLKPENLFLAAREGGRAVVKVLDFGIAKLLSESVWQSQQVRGTPPFMAYEQFTSGPVTPRLDVWALGLIAFYLLTGRKYWLATSRGGEEIGVLLNEILVQPLVPPTERAAALGVSPGLPAAFDAWFFGCVNRDVSARFASAGAAIAALDLALAGGVGLSKAEASAARAELARKARASLKPDAPAPAATGDADDDDDEGAYEGEAALSAPAPRPSGQPPSSRDGGPGPSSRGGGKGVAPPRGSGGQAAALLAGEAPPARPSRGAFVAVGGDHDHGASVATTLPPSVMLGRSVETNSLRPARVTSFRALAGVAALGAMVALVSARTKSAEINGDVNVASANVMPPASPPAGSAAPNAPAPVVVPVDVAADDAPPPGAPSASTPGARRRPPPGGAAKPGDKTLVKPKAERADEPAAPAGGERGAGPEPGGAPPPPAPSAKTLYDRR